MSLSKVRIVNDALVIELDWLLKMTQLVVDGANQEEESCMVVALRVDLHKISVSLLCSHSCNQNVHAWNNSLIRNVHPWKNSNFSSLLCDYKINISVSLKQTLPTTVIPRVYPTRRGHANSATLSNLRQHFCKPRPALITWWCEHSGLWRALHY